MNLYKYIYTCAHTHTHSYINLYESQGSCGAVDGDAASPEVLCVTCPSAEPPPLPSRYTRSRGPNCVADENPKEWTRPRATLVLLNV